MPIRHGGNAATACTHHACSMTHARLVVLALFAFFAPALAQAEPCECKDVNDMIYRIKEANALIAEYRKQIEGMKAKEAATGKPLMYTDSLYNDTLQPRQQAVATEVRLAEPGVRTNTATAQTSGSACTTEISGGTACLREAIERHEAHHRHVCELKKGLLVVDVFTDFDYRKGMRLVDVALEEIVGYFLEINYLAGELKAIARHCPFKVDGMYWDAYHFTGTICNIDREFTLQAKSGAALTEGLFTFKDGAWRFSGKWAGTGAVSASSSYRFEGLETEIPSLIMDAGSNWTAVVPLIGRVPFGEGGQHFDTGTEAIKLVRQTEPCP